MAGEGEFGLDPVTDAHTSTPQTIKIPAANSDASRGWRIIRSLAAIR